MRAFEVLCVFPLGINESSLSVECSQENDRKPSTTFVEEGIESIWEERRLLNPSLYNGSKFRYHSVDVSSPTAALLRIGITDYKSFLGTNCREEWKELNESHLASPLGNAAIVETSDEMVVLLRRSGDVGECPHTVVMPGGHPEPEMVGIKTLDDWKNKPETPDNIVDWKKNIVTELFDSMVREVVEETGIPRENLENILCLGFTRRVQNYRPDIIFYMSCTLSSQEVQELYAKGPEHSFESTELLLMNRNELVEKVIEKNVINMPGCHRGGIELFRQYLLKTSKDS